RLVHQRRAGHAPGQVAVVFEYVGFPAELARRQVETDELARGPQGEGAVAENGGRGAGPVAAEALAEQRRPGVGPALAAAARVVADDGLLAAALLDGHGDATGGGEARVAAADRLAPQLARRLGRPVGRQGGAADVAVAPRAEVAGEVVGRGRGQRHG